MSNGNTNPRLTMLQVTRLLGTPIGRLRANPTFPAMRHGAFDEALVIAWQAGRDANSASPNTTLTVQQGTT